MVISFRFVDANIIKFMDLWNESIKNIAYLHRQAMIIQNTNTTKREYLCV